MDSRSSLGGRQPDPANPPSSVPHSSGDYADRPTSSSGSDEPSPIEFCGGCRESVRPECRGSLAQIGACKVHWECWSDCNLSCPFCYRTRGTPLKTEKAEQLLAAIATSGVETAVFAGGDPSLRRDIGHLLAYARSLGLITEVHTNGQYAPERYQQALIGSDYVGLSLDGPSAELHDGFRGRPGNFRRVLELFDFLGEAAVPMIVRTVVARPNFTSVVDIGGLLAGRRNLISWNLLEFSPVGTGYRNRIAYQLDRTQFDAVANKALERFGETIHVYVSRLEDKSGTYVLVTPDGQVYGTLAPPADGIYPLVGSMLHEHLSDLSGAIGFRQERHEVLYLAGEDRRRRKVADLSTRHGPRRAPTS
jgi:pyruvate-formate lyase-activating enzyme